MSSLRRWWRPSQPGSSDIARDRLKLVLVHDRLNMPEELVDSLKSDLIEVLSRYFDIDQASLEVDVQRAGQYNRLVTTISLRRKT